MRLPLAWSFLAFTVVACGDDDPPPCTEPAECNAEAGLTIRVTCVEKVYEHACGVGGIIVSTTDGVELVRQDANGEEMFIVPLEPGEYTLAAESGPSQYPSAVVEQAQVVVTSGAFVDVGLTYWDGRRSSER